MRKQWTALILALILIASQMPALAAGRLADYPEVKIDPATGRPYNLKGKTVYIYDWWTTVSWDRTSARTGDERKLADYRRWIQDTYNCVIKTGSIADWNTQAESFVDFCSHPDGSLRIYIVPSTYVTYALQYGMPADWSKSSSIQIWDNKWNTVVTEMMTLGGGVYGLFSDANDYINNQLVLYFNKDVLKKAKVDYRDIYDMQEDGTWTWTEFEKILKKLGNVRGVTPIASSYDNLCSAAVFSNGGDFFHFSSGSLTVGINSKKSLEALEWAVDLYTDYGRQQKSYENWDFYQTMFIEGSVGFTVMGLYWGFNADPLVLEDGSWGCVAFPKGPKSSSYLTFIQPNVAMIPDVYDSKTFSALTAVYDAWCSRTPGTSLTKEAPDYVYDGRTDDRAIEDAFLMLQSGEYLVADLTILVGASGDVLGERLFWQLPHTSPGELVDASLSYWQNLCKSFNRKTAERYDH